MIGNVGRKWVEITIGIRVRIGNKHLFFRLHEESHVTHVFARTKFIGLSY